MYNEVRNLYMKLGSKSASNYTNRVVIEYKTCFFRIVLKGVGLILRKMYS